MRCRVELTARADVSASVEVEADSEEAAGKAAKVMAQAGNVDWGYDGADDSTVEVETIQPKGGPSA